MTQPIPTTPRRRHYDTAMKKQILAECERPGASIAAVAMAHGINANLVHKWRARAMQRQGSVVAPQPTSFLSVPLPAAGMSASATTEVRIELRRGPVTATVSWPLSAVTECAAWLREVLR